MSEFIYTLTLIKNDGYGPKERIKAGRNLEKHTIGWFDTLEEADNALPTAVKLIENYDIAVIEKMRHGLTGLDYGRWFYAYDWRTKTFSRIDEPDIFKALCNFSMG